MKIYELGTLIIFAILVLGGALIANEEVKKEKSAIIQHHENEQGR